MQTVFQQQSRDSWLAKLDAVQVPCGPINSIDQALQMPQVLERGMIVDFDNGVSVLGSPIKLSDTPVEYLTPPPKLGEHTLSILSEFHSPEAIAELQQAGVI